jgi:hypothetical protein
MRVHRLLHPLLLAVVAASCGGLFDPDDEWTREPGRLHPEISAIQMLQMPTQATAGVPFEITVTTRGSSSCTRPDGMTVSVSGLTADVTPWDQVAPQRTPCTDDLAAFPRTGTVRFDVAGSATIRLHGRDGLLYEASLAVVPAA